MTLNDPNRNFNRSLFFDKDLNLDIVGALNTLNLDDDDEIIRPSNTTPNPVTSDTVANLTSNNNTNNNNNNLVAGLVGSLVPGLTLHTPQQLSQPQMSMMSPMSPITPFNQSISMLSFNILNPFNTWNEPREQIQLKEFDYWQPMSNPRPVRPQQFPTNVHRKPKRNDTKYINATLQDFTGEIYSLCKDQHGCRFLQRQLDIGNSVIATMIFNEIYLKIVELMIDPFGNYLIQKLFESVGVDQRTILVKNAGPELLRVALDPHGTRALQKLVDCITTDEECQVIISNLKNHVVTLSRDLNGNHVVQKCLSKMNSNQNQFIFDTATDNCNDIATHRHGCCVLQRCLDYGSVSQRKQLLSMIAKNATDLSLDPFGNYVVQYVLSRGDEGSIQMILDHITNNFIVLSMHKFGSNVIEKSLRINKLSGFMVKTLIAKGRLADMLNDAYGNYVLQTSLDVARGEDMVRLSEMLEPMVEEVRNTPHGRRIMAKIGRN